MAYPFKSIEKKWQSFWAFNHTFSAKFPSDKPKYYVMDMFPYPSGSGLHVGHPLGYIASDIISRFKKLKGYNVLHPMGFDSFGLPAEQYAIKTGQHPKKTTATEQIYIISLQLCISLIRRITLKIASISNLTFIFYIVLFR